MHAPRTDAAGTGGRAPHGAGSLPRQVLVQGVGTTLNAAGGLLVVLVLGRLLGPERFGDYVAILSAAVVVLTLLEGGWPARVYRDGVLAPELGRSAQGLVGSALGYLLLIATLIGIVLLPVALERPAYLAALACMALVAMMNLVSARMRAAGHFGLEAGWQLGGRIASAALIIGGALWLSSTVGAVFLYWALGLALMLGLLGRRWLARPSWRGLPAALPLTLPFLGIELLVALLMKGDVALARLVGAAEASLSFYAACTRLNEAALLLFAPLANVLLRRLRLQATDAAGFARSWRGGVLLAALAGVAAVLGGLLLGEPLMDGLFGAAYRPAGRLLPYTAAVLPFALGNLILIQAMLAQGSERTLLLLLVPAAASMLGGLLLGWRLGDAAGGALGLAFAHALIWGVAIGWLIHRRADAPAAGQERQR